MTDDEDVAAHCLIDCQSTVYDMCAKSNETNQSTLLDSCATCRAEAMDQFAQAERRTDGQLTRMTTQKSTATAAEQPPSSTRETAQATS